jgi:hypothetical protein
MEILTCRHSAGIPTLFGITVLPAPEAGGVFVLLHELAENPGPPISLAAPLVVEELLQRHRPLLRGAALDCIRWFEHYFGPEDGVAETYLELSLRVEEGNVAPYVADGVARREVDAATLRYLRRTLEYFGDDSDVYGCFNIH